MKSQHGTAVHRTPENKELSCNGLKSFIEKLETDLPYGGSHHDQRNIQSVVAYEKQAKEPDILFFLLLDLDDGKEGSMREGFRDTFHILTSTNPVGSC